MHKKPIVKARGHHGTNSFDITIPVNICNAHKINEGDVFSVDTEYDEGILKLIYTRIFQQE